MRKLYIFDMGGVLARNFNEVPAILNMLGCADAEEFLRYRELFQRLMAGKLTGEEFWSTFSRKSGIPVKGNLWGRFFSPEVDSEMLELLDALKPRGRVVCGTNTMDEHFRIHQSRNDYAVFDAVYASHLIGIAKPDPEFFLYILDQERVEPHEAVFIDDLEENVLAARSLGIESILFTGAEKLRRRFCLNPVE